MKEKCRNAFDEIHSIANNMTLWDLEDAEKIKKATRDIIAQVNTVNRYVDLLLNIERDYE